MAVDFSLVCSLDGVSVKRGDYRVNGCGTLLGNFSSQKVSPGEAVLKEWHRRKPRREVLGRGGLSRRNMITFLKNIWQIKEKRVTILEFG